MGVGIFAQRRMAGHNMTVEFKGAVANEAPGFAVRILGIDRGKFSSSQAVI